MQLYLKPEPLADYIAKQLFNMRTASLEHFLINTALVDLYHVRELTRGTACHPKIIIPPVPVRLPASSVLESVRREVKSSSSDFRSGQVTSSSSSSSSRREPVSAAAATAAVRQQLQRRRRRRRLQIVVDLRGGSPRRMASCSARQFSNVI